MKRTLCAAALFTLCVTLSGLQSLFGQCTTLSYRIVSADEIGVRCSTPVTRLPQAPDGTPAGTMKVGDAVVTMLATPYTAMPAVVRLAPGENALWLAVQMASGNTLAPATKYSVVMTLLPAAKDAPGAVIPAVSIDTTSSYTVNPSKSDSYPDRFSFRSNLALNLAGNTCTLRVTTALAGDHEVPNLGCSLRSTTLPGDWDELGIATIVLRQAPVLQMLPNSLTGPTDLFGNTPTIPKTARIAALKPPSTKDVAAYFFNLSFVGATGSSPAFTVDAKVIPKLIPGLYGGFEINPFVGSASVGQGSISSAKYTDTIDLGSNVVRSFEPQNQLLDAVILTPGIKTETDKAFDTWNLLGTVDVKLNPAGLYHPQLRKQLQNLAALVKSDTSRSWTLADVPASGFGYVFEAHALLETGRKIADTTVQNSAKTASMTLPEYAILRPGIQTHTLLQLNRFSLDSVLTARYLAVTEDSVRELADKSLFLYPSHGWKAYHVLTGAYQIDPIGHWGISVTYNDGFTPPKYTRSNSVQVGLLVKY